jgi:hypothetical protein
MIRHESPLAPRSPSRPRNLANQDVLFVESPVSSASDERGVNGNGIYDDRLGQPGVQHDELGVVCPSSTTERKLMAKIDLRVIPVLSILYLLAFLDRCAEIKYTYEFR